MHMDRMTTALAGLLHDIGKFWQRAGNGARGPGYESSGPEDYGQRGAHATWSAAFIEHHVPQSLWDVGDAVLYHHRPQDHLSKIVALADRLASGEQADETDEQPRSLLSVFCQIGEDGRLRPKSYIPLRPLALDEATIFPLGQIEDDAAAYSCLWEQFERDAAVLQAQDDAEAYIESMYHLLYRYTWCMPSAFYRGMADISLYDHSRVTAAVAACLADFDETKIDELLTTQEMTQQRRWPIWLRATSPACSASFTHSLPKRGVAKGLRGRSFYLQLLNEAIARYILRQMGLPITSLIYVGGGHFYLLIPPSCTERLRAIQGELDNLLLAHHDGALYVALGSTKLHATDFQADRFTAKWREVTNGRPNAAASPIYPESRPARAWWQ